MQICMLLFIFIRHHFRSSLALIHFSCLSFVRPLLMIRLHVYLNNYAMSLFALTPICFLNFFKVNENMLINIHAV